MKISSAGKIRIKVTKEKIIRSDNMDMHKSKREGKRDKSVQRENLQHYAIDNPF